MYNQYLELKPCKTGKGVFTKIEIPANVPIIEVRGPVYLEEELPDPNHPALLQVGPNSFIGASGDLDDYINHSCKPNSYMHVAGVRAILYSMYVITAGSQITFDYSTTSTDTLDKWKMDCMCGNFNCRKVISGHQTMDWYEKEDYRNKGRLPAYISNPEMFQKKYKGNK